jgi:lipopolysaccharide biosynthesis glycosyltransferase
MLKLNLISCEEEIKIEKATAAADVETAEENNDEEDNGGINVGITFTKTTGNDKLKAKFKLCVSSLLKYATVDINFYIIGDTESQYVAKEILSSVKKNRRVKYRVVSLDADDLAKRMHQLVSKMQSHFSHSPASYYGDSLFFLSIGLFKVFDPKVKRIILLDADLKFKTDISKLHALFNKFNESNLIGIAHDGQPVYRHLFWQYRNENPGTRVGSPPPNGLTGFNSGVLLLDLAKQRKSSLYESLLTPEAVDRLTAKYHFKGHLGDQDFFTLVGMEHEELFYVLPCTWNRQLCTWWGDHGYADVLDQYYKCSGRVNIYHGNCDTRIPQDEDDAEYDKVLLSNPPGMSQRTARVDL